MMLFHRPMRRFMVWVLVLTLVFEPLVLTVQQARAQESRRPQVQELGLRTDDIDPASFVKPMQVLLSKLLSQQGLTRKQIYSRAWANWAIIEAQARMFLGRESHELISLERMVSPDNIKTILDRRDMIVCAPKFLQVGVSVMGALGNILELLWLRTGSGMGAVMRVEALAQHLRLARDATQRFNSGSTLLRTLEAWSYPGESVGLNGERIMNAFTKTEGTGLPVRAAPVAGVARIGMGILALYGVYKDTNDLLGNYQYSTFFENAVTGVGIALDLVMVFAWFALPVPVGEIIGAIQIVLLVAKEMIAAYKSWLDTKELAYQDSHRFLMDCDPEFQSLMNNESSWPPEIKSEGYKMLEEARDELNPSGENTENLPIKRGYETAMNQARVMTYYNRSFPSPLGTNIDTLKQMWVDKMDYMKWRPTQRDVDAAEDERRAPTWQRVVGYALWACPIYWAYRGVRAGVTAAGQAINANNISDQHPRVWYNPDFYLYQQVKRFSDPGAPSVARFLKARIETAPYHLIPLVEIPVDQWGTVSEGGPVLDALLADRYLCIVKTLKSIETLVKSMTKTIKEKADGIWESVGNVRRNHVDKINANLRALKDLAVAFRTDKARPAEDVWERVKDRFDLDDLPSGQEPTPENVVNAHRLLIQNYINVAPFALGNRQVEAICWSDSIIGFFLLYKIFERLYGPDTKREAEQILSQIRSERFRKFIERKEYLTFETGILVSPPNIPKQLMENLLKSVCDNDGEARAAFRAAVDYMAATSDTDFADYRMGDRPLYLYWGTLKGAQAGALDALKAWKQVEADSGVRIKVPINGRVMHHANDSSYRWVESSDADTRDLFLPDFSSRLFALDPEIEHETNDPSLILEIYRACGLDQTPQGLFDPPSGN